MRTLWFKQIYVEPILAGEKVDTVRDRSKNKLQPGEMVAFSVGPRTPFARAEILSREDIVGDDLTADRRRQVDSIYANTPALCRLTFRLLSR